MSLNDQTFVECSAGLSKRMKDAGSSIEDQIAYGFYLVTSRKPRGAEIQELLKLYHASTAETANDPATSSVGLAQIASLLLNLDESLTK
jgi:hypothetical protein